MYFIGVRDKSSYVIHWSERWKKQKWKKKAKINLSILIFFPTIHLSTLKVYTKFEDFGLEAEKSVTEILIGEKEK